MTLDSTQIREALKYFEGKRMKGMPPPEGYLAAVLDAARAYADLLEGDTEPDYAAAFRHGKEVLAALGASFTDEDRQQIRAIVDAGIAGRRLLPGAHSDITG